MRNEKCEMSKNLFYDGLLLFVAILILSSCHESGKTEEESVEGDTLKVDSTDSDAISEEEKILEEVSRSGHVDELFDDFLYTFSHIHAMQKQRVEYPLADIAEDGTNVGLQKGEFTDDMNFLDGEYTTTFWNSRKQTSLKEDTTLTKATVEKLDLDNHQIVAYDFHKKKGKWMLYARRHQKFQDADMPDFLEFYSRFSSDSLYRQGSLSNNIKVNMLDPDNEDQSISGTIDPQQFPVMCPEVPSGQITNIRYGQNYSSPRKIILEKSGQSNGMSEIFTFEKEGKEWKLTEYDN